MSPLGSYTYWLEILDDLPYQEVTEIFVRVNSRGRALKETDLVLATPVGEVAGCRRKD